MQAPELVISKWFNTNTPLSLQALKGKVIAIHAFQMLCPGCVFHGIPQAQKVFETFNPNEVVVLGLHSVFEHHEGMQEASLRAFLHEFRIKFPVGIDSGREGHDIPETMKRYQIRGTPTWLLIDQKGELSQQIFGRTDDLVLGAEITKLILKGQTEEINIYKKETR